MNTAHRLPSTTSLDSTHPRNSTPGMKPTAKNHTLSQTFDTPSLRNEGEGVTLCPTCKGAGYELHNHNEAARCTNCNGDGIRRQ